MTKISVVIPAYNSEPYLREALDSVLNQSSKAHEIIVVNDGSTDSTEEIALSYGDRIRYIKQENQGLSGARNTGIREAVGDWIALFDSDDVMLPDKISKQLAVIEADPKLVVVYSAFTYLYPDGTKVLGSVFPARDLWPALRYRTPILPSTSIIRRSVLSEVGGFNKIATEDWDLWFRIVRRYSADAFQEVPDSLLLYRQREDSLSRKFIALAAATFHLLDTALLDGLSGFSKIIWRRRIEARFYYQLAVSLREAGDARYWGFAIESFLKWPLWGRVVPFQRYRVFAHMLYKRFLNFRFNLRYWWPGRGCTELVR